MKKLAKFIFLIALLPVGNAYAITLNFLCISGNSSCEIGEVQLSVEIEASGGGTEFTFFNIDPNDPSVDDGINPGIHEIYFDSSLLSGLASYSGIVSLDNAGTSANYSLGNPRPRNLPGGNPVGFNSDFGLDVLSGRGRNTNPLQEDDQLTVFFEDISFNTFLQALDMDNLDIGLHVGAMVNGDSASFVSTINPVPVPAAFWLFGTALIGLVGFSKRRKAA